LTKKTISGYNIELWESLGFKFVTGTPFDGVEKWYGECQIDNLVFSLTINSKTNFTLAKIENLKGEKIGNHVLKEDEAIKWFSSKSDDFKLKLKMK